MEMKHLLWNGPHSKLFENFMNLTTETLSFSLCYVQCSMFSVGLQFAIHAKT